MNVTATFNCSTEAEAKAAGAKIRAALGTGAITTTAGRNGQVWYSAGGKSVLVIGCQPQLGARKRSRRRAAKRSEP